MSNKHCLPKIIKKLLLAICLTSLTSQGAEAMDGTGEITITGKVGSICTKSGNSQISDTYPKWTTDRATFQIDFKVIKNTISGRGHFSYGNTTTGHHLKTYNVSGKVNTNGSFDLRVLRAGMSAPTSISGNLLNADVDTPSSTWANCITYKRPMFIFAKRNNTTAPTATAKGITTDTADTKESANSPKNKAIRNAFNKLPLPTRAKVQEKLSELNLYSSTADGLYGPKTETALLSFLTSKNIPHDKTTLIDSALTQLITKTQNVSFTETSNVRASSETLEEEKNNIRKQKFAKLFLADIEDHVSSGQSTFDLNFAIEFSKVVAIKKGQWSKSLELAFDQFKAYALSDASFRLFHENKTDERQKDEQLQIVTKRNELLNLLALMRLWAKENLLNEKTSGVINFIIEAESIQKNDDLEEIGRLLSKAISINMEIGITKPTPPAVGRYSEFTKDTLYIFGNFSGRAKHIFKGLSGNPELADDTVEICLIGTMDRWQRYTAIDYVNGELNPKFRYVVQDACFGNEDILAAVGNSLIDDQLPPVFKDGFETLAEISRATTVNIRSNFSTKSEFYENSLLKGELSGYGLLSFDATIPATCVVVTSDTTDHIDALRGNDDLSLLFVGILNDIQFNDNILEAFRKIQREECGFIYSKSENLVKLIDAAKNNNLEYSLLPVWISNEAVQELSTLRTEIAKKRLSEQEARAQRQLLNQKAIEAAKQKALVRQATLREQYQVRHAAILDELMGMIKVAVDFGFNHSPLDSNYKRKYLELNIIDPVTETTSPFDPIIEDIQNLSLEKWEQTGSIIEKLDYGTVEYNGRTLEGVISEIKVSMKNRIIGDFQTYCRKVLAVQDDDFDIWRKVEIVSCDDNDEEWRLIHDFKSRWVVLTDE